jgi:hypothetical protein
VKVWDAKKLGDEERSKRQCVLLVRDLFAMLDAQTDVLEHLRQDRFLGEPLRSEAIAQAQKQHPNPGWLNEASWYVVSKVDMPIVARQRALRQAREACRIEPDNGFYLNILGVALYRSGQYQAALEALTRSEKLNASPRQGSHPTGLNDCARFGSHHLDAQVVGTAQTPNAGGGPGSAPMGVRVEWHFRPQVL